MGKVDKGAGGEGLKRTGGFSKIEFRCLWSFPLQSGRDVFLRVLDHIGISSSNLDGPGLMHLSFAYSAFPHEDDAEKWRREMVDCVSRLIRDYYAYKKFSVDFDPFEKLVDENIVTIDKIE